MVDASKIKEHMEVFGADGEHVGTVDHMEGPNKIKLTKSDPAAHGGHHHLIPLDWVHSVDQHVRLSKISSEVMRSWEHVA
jgi:hypothetical protein